MVLNIAHRGGAALAPENTLVCFKKGILYADMIEFDVQPTNDKKILVFHDRKGIERTTNGHGNFSDLSYKYLRSLDAGSWFNADFKGEKIPTVLEAINIIPKNMLINLEIKFYDPISNWFEKRITDIIKQFSLEDRLVITARYPENIIRILNLNSSLNCALLQKERERDSYFREVVDLGLSTVQIRKSALSQQFVHNCHNNDIQVFYFYADELDHMQEAIDIGVDGILTNYPNRLKKLLEKREK